MTTDVNEAFAAERRGQIAAAADSAERAARAEASYQERFDSRLTDGTLKDLGGGRYQVTDPGSWDNGEILLRRYNTAGQAVILPEHGLDETGGKVALYTAVPAWHGLGTVIPGGISDVDEVIRLAGLDYQILQRPAEYTLPDGTRRTVTTPATGQVSAFVNVRSDTGDPFGVTGKVYTPVQVREAFAFLQRLTDSGEVLWESAGATGNGARAFISMRLPDTLVIDPAGIADTVIPFLSAIDDRTGSGPFQVVASPWRIACGNTERFAVRDAWTRWAVRHTTSVLETMSEARRTLGLSLRYYERFTDEETTLAQMEMGLSGLAGVADVLWPAAPDATDRQKLNTQKRMESLAEIFTVEAARVGETGYAAERAITGYLDNVTARRGGDEIARARSRAAAVLLGADDDKKSTAHRLLMELAA